MEENYIWKNLQSVLLKKHTNLNVLSQRIKVPRTSLYNIKHGSSKNPSFQLMEKIADALNISMDEFRNDYKKK